MFDQEILTRAVLAIIILASGALAYWLLNRFLILRAHRRQPELPAYQTGKPAILYFTTPDCAACKTVQRPALQRLKERMGDRLEVIEINAQECPELASQWGVLSVPSTFVLDSSGTLRHVNHGAARAEKLLEQLASAR